jgi:hypothetical protein
MKPLCCASILLLIGIPVASESAKSIHADRAPNAEEEIKSLEAKLTEQILSGNPGYGDSLAEDYVLIRDDGSVHTKSEMTARFTARDPANRIEALQPSNLSIRIYGDTAVMNFELNWTQTVNGRRLSAHSRLTKVFIKREGRWYMINNQGTFLSPPRELPAQN